MIFPCRLNTLPFHCPGYGTPTMPHPLSKSFLVTSAAAPADRHSIDILSWRIAIAGPSRALLVRCDGAFYVWRESGSLPPAILPPATAYLPFDVWDPAGLGPVCREKELWKHHSFKYLSHACSTSSSLFHEYLVDYQ